jgi:hypothetical protein
LSIVSTFKEGKHTAIIFVLKGLQVVLLENYTLFLFYFVDFSNFKPFIDCRLKSNNYFLAFGQADDYRCYAANLNCQQPLTLRFVLQNP